MSFESQFQEPSIGTSEFYSHIGSERHTKGRKFENTVLMINYDSIVISLLYFKLSFEIFGNKVCLKILKNRILADTLLRAHFSKKAPELSIFLFLFDQKHNENYSLKFLHAVS